MQKLYRKSELWFAIVWIIVYVVGASAADSISELIGIKKVLSLPFLAVLSAVAWNWIRKNGLETTFGLCRTDILPGKFLYYIPLALIATCSLWFGVAPDLPVVETVLYIGSMLCVGFLEELIFRGFLFQAMRKDHLQAAVIVSSVSFGIGHLVNLINGSGAELLATLCQVCYAAAFGFLCVILFYRGKSLWPCVITHSSINALSVFTDKASMTQQTQIISTMLLTAVAVVYALVLLKTLPKPCT